jgi:hypothetical protein
MSSATCLVLSCVLMRVNSAVAVLTTCKGKLPLQQVLSCPAPWLTTCEGRLDVVERGCVICEGMYVLT